MTKKNKKISFIIMIISILLLSFNSYADAEEIKSMEKIQNREKPQNVEEIEESNKTEKTEQNEKNQKLEIETEYIYNDEKNIVTGIIKSNNQLKDTKVSWKLSEDKLTYTNENLTSNGSYYTIVEDIYGNTAKVLIDVTLVDDKRTRNKNGIHT